MTLVLRYRNNLTLKETGAIMECGIEGARQLQNAALRKLRSGRAIKRIREAVEIGDKMLFRGSYKDFRTRGGSVVEAIAVKRVELNRANEV